MPVVDQETLITGRLEILFTANNGYAEAHNVRQKRLSIKFPKKIRISLRLTSQKTLPTLDCRVPIAMRNQFSNLAKACLKINLIPKIVKFPSIV